MNRNAEDEAARAKCSEATLQGTYLVAYDGVVTGGPDKAPFAVAALEVFDGNGKIKGVYSAHNADGKITKKEPTSGTYTVKADCTGTSTYSGDGFVYKYDLFIAPDGSMITFVQTDPPEGVVSGVAQRVARKRGGD
jgi:hypothetical protein